VIVRQNLERQSHQPHLTLGKWKIGQPADKSWLSGCTGGAKQALSGRYFNKENLQCVPI
jgi:hypothetical protein